MYGEQVSNQLYLFKASRTQGQLFKIRSSTFIFKGYEQCKNLSTIYNLSYRAVRIKYHHRIHLCSQEQCTKKSHCFPQEQYHHSSYQKINDRECSKSRSKLRFYSTKNYRLRDSNQSQVNTTYFQAVTCFFRARKTIHSSGRDRVRKCANQHRAFKRPSYKLRQLINLYCRYK